MIDMMQAVIDHGTGRRLRYAYDMKGPIAGKTGTTNSNSDGWFVGCVPQLVTSVWVGGDERDIHFNSTSIGQGAASALPVWALYMRRVYADKRLGYDSNREFENPKQLMTIIRREFRLLMVVITKMKVKQKNTLLKVKSLSRLRSPKAAEKTILNKYVLDYDVLGNSCAS